MEKNFSIVGMDGNGIPFVKPYSLSLKSKALID